MVCLNCENEFNPKRDTAKFCSDLCRATFNQNIKNKIICVKIYALISPLTNQPFYIGKTVGTLTQRLNSHIKDKEGNIKKMATIEELKIINLVPTITLLEEILCETEDQEVNALMREKYWMDFYKNEVPLCNTQGIIQSFKPRMLSQYKKSASYNSNGGRNKSRPMGIRFEDKDFEFICKRENLKTPQSVVYFLMKEYMKLYKVEKKSIFDTESEVKVLNTTLQKDLKPHENFKIKRSFEYFMQARRGCQDEEDWMELKEEILSSDLSEKQKILLTT